MSNESTLPRWSVVFDEALRPIARKMRARMDTPPPQTEQVTDMLEFVSCYLKKIRGEVGQLCDEIGELNRVASTADASDADAYRTAARIEVRLERLLASYDEVRCVNSSHADTWGWSLLIDSYREILLRIQDWLDEVVEVLDDPISIAKKRGLPTQEVVRLTLTLNLAGLPQLEKLTHWAERQAAALAAARAAEEEDFARRGRQLALVAFGLGWLLGDDE